MYGQGLSQAAALSSAQLHNETNQLQRATSFSEISGTCRRLLFNEFGPDLDDGPGCPMPDVPRYNTHGYREFKAKCLSILVSTQTVSLMRYTEAHLVSTVIFKLQSAAMVEQAIQMELQPSIIYPKMQMAFSLFEEGKLKGQRPKELKGLAVKKALEGRYAPKLSQFKVFQGLKVYCY